MTTLVRNKPMSSDFLQGFWDRGGIDEYTESKNPYASPAINIRDDENAYIIELGVPGYDKKDFSISIEEQMIIVRGELTSKDEPSTHFAHREFEVAGFERSFRLPRNVQEEKIKASYKNGILFITIPKDTDMPDQSRRITIS